MCIFKGDSFEVLTIKINSFQFFNSFQQRVPALVFKNFEGILEQFPTNQE